MTEPPPHRKPTFVTRLLDWYDRERRDLPWRRTSDPWAVWVSEIMLQQTRVEAVREAYSRFLEAYPTPADFAAVGDDELLAAWRGLGYYRRARLLRAGARAVVVRHAGAVPAEPESLAALPGIGEYTLGAVGSIAFGLELPAVDGNVERVLSRHGAIREPVRKGPGRRAVRDRARVLVDGDRPGDRNQALMELGATICTPRAPRCTACPIACDCRALKQGLVDALPVLPRRRETVEVRARGALVRHNSGAVIGHRVPPGEINAGQLDLLGPGPLSDCHDADELAAAIFERFGLRVEVGAELGAVRHAITHHRIVYTAHRASTKDRARGGFAAAPPDDPTAPWTTLARKVFALAGLTAER